MITANELRVGNIVNRENTGHPLVITAEHIFYWDKFKDVLFPMKLNHRILENCGFTGNIGYSMFGNTLYGNKVIAVFFSMGELTFGNTTIKYLHTFQNYYPAWTNGKELEVKFWQTSAQYNQ